MVYMLDFAGDYVTKLVATANLTYTACLASQPKSSSPTVEAF